MAIFHLHVKNISRGAGPRIRSAVAAAAYRAGETLPNDAEERASKFGGRRDVVHAEIRLPEGAPAWMGDRAQLWNAVEAAEKRRDARLAKEIEFSLPRELDQAAWIALARKMADAYTSQGHVADVAIHEDGRGHNPHAHIMLTTRTIGPEGFGLKMREADGKAFVRSARALWEKIANEALGTAGSAVMIDARSHAARGLSHDPGRHRGADPEERRLNREQATMAREHTLSSEIEQAYGEAMSALEAPDHDRETGLDRARDIFDRMRDRLSDQMVRMGVMSPQNAMQLRELEARLYPTRYDRDLARAREIEAKRNETGHMPKATTAQRREAEAYERQEKERNTVAYEPDRDLPRPDPDGRPIPATEWERAQDRMVEDVERPAEWMDAPSAPAPEHERAAAEQAVERAAELPVSDREADAYRVAPQESFMDWMRSTHGSDSQRSSDQERERDRDRDIFRDR